MAVAGDETSGASGSGLPAAASAVSSSSTGLVGAASAASASSLKTRHSIFIKDNKFLASLIQWHICFLPCWSRSEIKCNVHVSHPKCKFFIMSTEFDKNISD